MQEWSNHSPERLSGAMAEYTVVLSAVSSGFLEPLTWNFVSPHCKHKSSGFLSSLSHNHVL